MSNRFYCTYCIKSGIQQLSALCSTLLRAWKRDWTLWSVVILTQNCKNVRKRRRQKANGQYRLMMIYLQFYKLCYKPFMSSVCYIFYDSFCCSDTSLKEECTFFSNYSILWNNWEDSISHDIKWALLSCFFCCFFLLETGYKIYLLLMHHFY